MNAGDDERDFAVKSEGDLPQDPIVQNALEAADEAALRCCSSVLLNQHCASWI